MSRGVAIAALLIGPLFAFMVWRAALAFKRGQVLRGLTWSTAALLECVLLATVLDQLLLHFRVSV